MAKKKKPNPHFGSSFDSFLEDDGILEEATAREQPKVLAYQLAAEMKTQEVSKSEMARRMKTSRTQINKLLDPESKSFRMDTAQKAAAALGRNLLVALD